MQVIALRLNYNRRTKAPTVHRMRRFA